MAGSNYGSRAGSSYPVNVYNVSDGKKEIDDDFSQAFRHLFVAPEPDFKAPEPDFKAGSNYGSRAGSSYPVNVYNVSDGKKEIDDDFSQAFRHLFVAPEPDFKAPGPDHLFNAPGPDNLFKAPEPYKLSFKNPKPFDLDKISSGPNNFPATGYIKEYFSDDELEINDTISYDKVFSGKAPKKVSSGAGATKRIIKAGMKYTRQTKRGLSPLRARMLEKETLRGGWLGSAHIEHGSYGPFGFEI